VNTTQLARALRRDACFRETSTMRSLPLPSTWESCFFTITTPSIRFEPISQHMTQLL
jgi:hypothetical protein